MALQQQPIVRLVLAVQTSLFFIALGSRPALAHCDGIDGPVVMAAREALRTGDVRPALVWVREGDEAEIRAAFEKATAVRKLGPQAQDVADTHFFETLVRVHRAAEGAPYTGLKPAGRDLGPAIPAADRALKTGDVEPLVKLLTDKTRSGVRHHFKQALGLRGYKPGDLEPARRYVAAYVSFIHYVESLYESAARMREGHYPDEAGSSGAHHDRR